MNVDRGNEYLQWDPWACALSGYSEHRFLIARWVRVSMLIDTCRLSLFFDSSEIAPTTKIDISRVNYLYVVVAETALGI